MLFDADVTAYLVNNYMPISISFLMCRSLRSGFPTPFQHLEACPLRATSGGPQTAAAGFLSIFGF